MRSLLLLFVTCCVLLPASVQAAGEPEPVVLTLPAAVVEESVRSVLPLPLFPPSEHLQGRLLLTSIERFELRDNGAHVSGVLRGSDLALDTDMGGQRIRVKVGDLQLQLTCDFTFRFDPVQQILYVTPVLQPPQPSGNAQADAVLPLLVLLNNREYPVSMASVQTFVARVGDRDIQVTLEPADLSITPEQVVVRMRPGLRQSH